MKKLLLILLLFSSCKKADTTLNSPDSWVGSYKKSSESCSLSSYACSARDNLTITATTFTIEKYALSQYLYNPVTINTNSGTIPADEMSTGDQNAGFDSWDMLGGTITKNGNTVTLHFSFITRFSGGSVKDNPVFDVVYKK